MISVFGTVFVDIKGYPEKDFNPVGRNVGKVQTVYGGVGHNVARNLNFLGHKVQFVSSVDLSSTGEDIIKKLNLNNIDTTYVAKSQNGMGIWQAIFDKKGDVAASISQQPDFSSMEHMVFNYGDEMVKNSDAVVLEIDLNPEISTEVCRLSKKHNKPIYMLVANLSVVYECPELLSYSDCFVCNDIEAKSLIKNFSGSDKDLCISLSEVYNLNKTVVSLGEKGSVHYDKALNNYGHAGIFSVNVADTAGAGDAFFSGIVHGLTSGHDLPSATRIGAKVASIVISCNESTTHELNEVHKYVAADFSL